MDLIILGTGVHSLEIAEIVERINSVSHKWNLLGYLSENEKGIGEMCNGYPVLGGPDGIGEFPDAFFVPAYGWPVTIPVPEERLVSVIDPSTVVSRSARIGAGCVVYPHGFIGVNAKIGRRVLMLTGCVVNHDDVIGDNSALTSGVILAGAVTVGENCYLGQGCMIRQQLCIGENCTVSMGAVVVKDMPKNAVVAGNPAKVIRMKE